MGAALFHFRGFSVELRSLIAVTIGYDATTLERSFSACSSSYSAINLPEEKELGNWIYVMLESKAVLIMLYRSIIAIQLSSSWG